MLISLECYETKITSLDISQQQFLTSLWGMDLLQRLHTEKGQLELIPCDGGTVIFNFYDNDAQQISKSQIQNSDMP